MTSANQAPGTTRLPGIDVILPIGKPGAAADRSPPEPVEFNGRSMLQWAVEAAAQAGANRILLVAPERHPFTADIIRQLRDVLMSRSALPDERQIQLATLIKRVTPDYGWDNLIHAAAAHVRGPQAMLIDPAMALISEGKVNTFTAFKLRRAAAEQTGALLLATAITTWQDALCLPVLEGTSLGLSLSRHRAPVDELTVFAGRALIPLPLAVSGSGAIARGSEDFPFEGLLRDLLARRAELLQQTVTPIDCRFEPALTSAIHTFTLTAPPIFGRLGLAALQHGA